MSLGWKKDRRLLLGVCGGISAYKTPELVREFKKLGWEVETILTPAAERFVSPLVISTLSGRRVWLEEDFLSREEGWKIPHISLVEWADLTLVAPATASFLHKAAWGDASDILSASILASRKPVLVFPAMNVFMWEHRAVRENVLRCRDLGYEVFEPEEGFLACGYEGKGRLPSPGVIREEVLRALQPTKDMEGTRVLITSGPTREAIDPVRFISNHSSGKMGASLARTAWYRGAEVTVISGPAQELPPHGSRVVNVVSAEEMYEAVMSEAPSQDIIIMAAAVGDFRPSSFSKDKIKRKGEQSFFLEMKQNRDIAAALGAAKKPGQFLVGFAAETDNAMENAREKLEKKGLDQIVVNEVGGPDGAFGSDRNNVRILDSGGVLASFEGSKDEVAEAIWDAVAQGCKDSGR
ncbi:MAG: bifunctional phosphopantothenoylcysteine decarboxylase/phosphopantothenate--cysteine ligase CoaBC [Thermovirgaceae bacterium]|nr:bifunctional phosphopantothenoylcysteine decarboxylase/phosphopantothenate--cysteine ligase CoaBC [Synergistales bacterium]HPC76113.1 bifunctional phosphopantothenoylcysteine decarboxylase/phosphopantothenate--cysteine ligase CoaBC [Synergistales bacterium]HRS48790.1 bifunctional phosphopantothenoylcysteine decarboxylase/phosphopantothenate--cysteine ligase CoaBC [Thermovirgaceae bacterium]HRU90994.1 bifunctional phosphopantothenoylcysteine decarboxylase/phosphopantothenate--cysteine ligase C